MEQLNIVNLFQAGTITVCVLGALLLWRTNEFRGVSFVLWLIAFASLINIFEETGLTRDVYLVSPIFIMLFGPANYLAIKLIVNKTLKPYEWVHLLPVIPFLMFTHHVQAIIALGTLWRLAYALLSVLILLKFKRLLDEQRSDSDEYSLNWLAGIVLLTSAFTLIDLIRLNTQHMISYELNLLGQGLNTLIWLVAIMVMIYMLSKQRRLSQHPIMAEATSKLTQRHLPDEKSEYTSVFSELDKLLTTNQWFLTPRLTLNQVSELTGLQSRDISRAINLCADTSFNDYINRYRVEHVCQSLVRQPNQSLLDVAVEAGFSSKASFNKVFKQITGTTPSEYKEHMSV